MLFVALPLVGCAGAPATVKREFDVHEVRAALRHGELDAVTHLRVVDATAGDGLDADTITALLRLPQLRGLDLGALPGLRRDGEQVMVAAGTQLLFGQLLRADLQPTARPRVLIYGEHGTTLPVLADLARPMSVELNLSGQLLPHDQSPQRAGSSFDPAVQRRLAAQTLVQVTDRLAGCCELVR